MPETKFMVPKLNLIYIKIIRMNKIREERYRTKKPYINPTSRSQPLLSIRTLKKDTAVILKVI